MGLWPAKVAGDSRKGPYHRSMTAHASSQALPGATPAKAGALRGVLAAVGVVVVTAGLAAGWRYGVAPNLHAKRFGEVVPGKLYRSGESTMAAIQDAVASNHIKTIIDLGAYKVDSPDERREQALADALHVTRYRFPLEGDATGNPNYYVQALKIMTDPQAQPVLVHCSAGTQRTGAAVMLYRHIIEGKSFDQTYAEANTFGHDANDNPRLLLMLADWSGAIEQAFKTDSAIPGVPAVPDAAPVHPSK